MCCVYSIVSHLCLHTRPNTELEHLFIGFVKYPLVGASETPAYLTGKNPKRASRNPASFLCAHDGSHTDT